MFCQKLRPFFAGNGQLFMRKKHTLPELPYDYKALEPVISRDIMNLHHSKHHAAYVTNLNAALEKLEKANKENDVSAAIALTSGIRFNGGGHINHSIFWKNLTSECTKPSPCLISAINRDFGDFETFKKELTTVSVGVQGSGWGWLGYNKKQDRLQCIAMANQDPLHASTGLVPLLGIDVWEHAYYLQYKNLRASYVESIFEIINWNDVSQRLDEAKKTNAC